jgi:uncharacterized membrane protein
VLSELSAISVWLEFIERPTWQYVTADLPNALYNLMTIIIHLQRVEEPQKSELKTFFKKKFKMHGKAT